MPSDTKTLKYVLRTIARRGCLCFVEPPDYMANHSKSDVAYLTAWKTDTNQRFLIEHGCHFPQFVIDVNTDQKLMQDLDNAKKPSFTYLVENIDNYRWFYMPLTDEDSIAIFVCRPLDTAWINRITQKFDNLNIPYTKIVNQGNCNAWRLNPELRKLWRLDK